MRIAFDYQTFTLQTHGGISRYFTQLTQGLLDLEQQVEVFAPLHRNRYLESLPQNSNVRLKSEQIQLVSVG